MERKLTLGASSTGEVPAMHLALVLLIGLQPLFSCSHNLLCACFFFFFCGCNCCNCNYRLLGIKRVALQQRANIKLDFVPPEEGHREFKLYFMCDSYLGCDQEYDLELDVQEPEDMDSSEEEEDEDEDEGDE